jgi:hypothetical protein
VRAGLCPIQSYLSRNDASDKGWEASQPGCAATGHPRGAVRRQCLDIFLEVSDLVQLSKPEPERIAILSLTAEGRKKPLTNKFILHGRALVKASFL